MSETNASVDRAVMRLADIDELLAELKRINEIPLEKIDLIGEDGKVISFSAGMLEEWKFIGLSNKFFIEQRYWENRTA